MLPLSFPPTKLGSGPELHRQLVILGYWTMRPRFHRSVTFTLRRWRKVKTRRVKFGIPPLHRSCGNGAKEGGRVSCSWNHGLFGACYPNHCRSMIKGTPSPQDPPHAPFHVQQDENTVADVHLSPDAVRRLLTLPERFIWWATLKIPMTKKDDNFMPWLLF